MSNTQYKRGGGITQNQNVSDLRKVYAVVGASNHSLHNRTENDFYATDPIAIELLMKEIEFSPVVWECACGKGHLSIPLEKRGYEVVSTDLIDRGFGIGDVDFLKINEDEEFDCDIITNPPYKYAVEFVRKALNLVTDGHTVAMLLRLQFLEGRKRRELFDEHPPKYVYVFSGRINCCGDADFSTNKRRNYSSAVAYAWFIWKKEEADYEPVIRWLN